MRTWAALVLAAVPVVYHDAPQVIDTKLEPALLAAEAAVEEYLRADPPRAERILRDIRDLTERQIQGLAVPAVHALPRTTGWVTRLGGHRLRIRVVHPATRLVTDGFAAFIVDDTLYFAADLEDRLPADRLMVVVAHELSHDRLDAVRKHLHRSYAGTTDGMEGWLASRLEDRAHIGAMKKLAAAGLDPRAVIDFVKRQKTNRFTKGQRDASVRVLEAALVGLGADSPTRLAR